MINSDIIKKTLEMFNIKELNPMQEEVIKKGLLDKKNLIISSPTASGKTLCAAMCSLKCYMENRKKVIYICPLVALAQEHYQNLKSKFSPIGIKIALSVGNLDDSDQWLKNFDWIICSNEKMDSLLRHEVDWIYDVDLIIIDEIHLISDFSRGPTLEVLLTKLKSLIPNAQIIGLSATIKNVDQLAKWLKSDFVVSKWRPVKLYEGVCYDGKIVFLDKESYCLPTNISDERSVVEDTLENGKQILIFVSTRKNAESLADKLSSFIDKKNILDKEQLNRISYLITNSLEVPTIQCEKLSKCVSNGVAFHHAGLVNKQRKIIEDEFRRGKLKIIVATPTLSMGVNLPAFRVVVRDLKRYYNGLGSIPIPVIEYKQFIGRAGRPQYDDFGESIIFAKNELHAQQLIDHYMLSETENIESKLSDESMLRSHMLSLIASNFVRDKQELYNFFENTFYSHEKNDLSDINRKIDRILKLLVKFGQIEIHEEKLKATKIGKRISELYLDPISGDLIISSLKKNNNIDVISILQLICSTSELHPLPSIKSSEVKEIESFLVKHQNNFVINLPNEWDESYEDFTKSVKLTAVLNNWLNEVSENGLLIKHSITPGELRNKLVISDWLLYSVYELSLLLGLKNVLTKIKKIRVRLKYGVKEELLPLVRLENIGRVRARKLYNSNLRSIDDLRKCNVGKLEKILGIKIAYNVKKQLGEKTFSS